MGSGSQSRGPARAGVLDLLQLGARLGADALRGKRADPAAAGSRWARGLMRRDAGADIDIVLPGKTFEIVGDREHSQRVLSGRPGIDGFVAGATKTRAMSFLAPEALTIANGDAWAQLRPFNEQVLGTGGPHQFAQAFLEHVHAAFARPVSSEADVRAAMGRAMVNIVVGAVSPDEHDPADDVSVLFDVVQSPVKRALLGFWYRGRRARLYDLLARKWQDSSGGPTLIALARQVAPAADRTTLLNQIPHWMFTFTGSGTDLLVRTLCMVTSRRAVHEKVLGEIRTAGESGSAETVRHLAYLEACVLETGRLFPPVTRTFHTSGSAADSSRELVHYFPLLQRDDRLGPTVHEFRPERWLAPELDAAATASNLFLRGPRACPGMDLILFVCKAAAARQLAELGLSARQNALTRDPLPISFPKLDGPFTASRELQ